MSLLFLRERGEKMKMYVCSQHVDKALDVVVDEYGTFPAFEEADISTDCEYCEDNAAYMVANTGSSTK